MFPCHNCQNCDGTLQQLLDTDCPNVILLKSTLVVTVHDLRCTLIDLLSTMLVDWPIIGLSACFAWLLIAILSFLERPCKPELIPVNWDGFRSIYGSILLLIRSTISWC